MGVFLLKASATRCIGRYRVTPVGATVRCLLDLGRALFVFRASGLSKEGAHEIAGAGRIRAGATKGSYHATMGERRRKAWLSDLWTGEWFVEAVVESSVLTERDAKYTRPVWEPETL